MVHIIVHLLLSFAPHIRALIYALPVISTFVRLISQKLLPGAFALWENALGKFSTCRVESSGAVHTESPHTAPPRQIDFIDFLSSPSYADNVTLTFVNAVRLISCEFVAACQRLLAGKWQKNSLFRIASSEAKVIHTSDHPAVYSFISSLATRVQMTKLQRAVGRGGEGERRDLCSICQSGTWRRKTPFSFPPLHNGCLSTCQPVCCATNTRGNSSRHDRNMYRRACQDLPREAPGTETSQMFVRARTRRADNFATARVNERHRGSSVPSGSRRVGTKSENRSYNSSSVGGCSSLLRGRKASGREGTLGEHNGTTRARVLPISTRSSIFLGRAKLHGSLAIRSVQWEICLRR